MAVPDLALKRKLSPEFMHLQKSRNKYAVCILVFYLAQIAALIALTYLTWHHLGGIGYAVLPVLMFLVATRLRGLNNIVHECSHLSFSDNKKANITLGSIAASFILASFKSYREEHLTHHRHLGDFEHDLDFMHRKVFRFDQQVTPLVFLRHLVTPILGLHMLHYFSVDLSARDGRLYQALKIALLLLTCAGLWLDPAGTILAVIIPYAWIFSAVNYWTDCVDHAGLITNDAELQQSRNVILPKFLKYILFPRNDSYHLIHHLFPHVPTRHFENCHRILMAEKEYSQGAPALDLMGKPSVREIGSAPVALAGRN